MVGKQLELDLSKFMPETLQIPSMATAPTRKMHSNDFKYYEEFVQRDPYLILNKASFEETPLVHENVKGSEIQEFFRNSNIFITGGTGFLGKVLIEKLLRSVPHLKHIYILIRPKRGKTAKERTSELFEDKVFLRMQTEVPHYLSMITVLEGDISEPGLGLSTEDRQTLIDNVDVVFNSAADVRFTQPLRKAIENNVFGSKRVLELCNELQNLKAFIHVSTAYSNCNRSFIEDKVYKVHTNYKEVMTVLDSIPESDLETVTERILQDWPNTYTFSKALCEEMIVNEGNKLPLCIVRPTVVIPTYKEPVRGWGDNLYGPMGLTLGVGLGVLHCFPVDLEQSIDFEPVDYVVNFLLAAAWITGCKRKGSPAVVYNFTSTSVRPTINKEFINFLLYIRDIWPFEKSMWYTSYISTSLYINDLTHLLLHTVPGKLLDSVLVTLGKKAMLTKIYQKVKVSAKVVSVFTNKTFRWNSDNVWTIWNKMSPEDQQLFCFDLASIDMKEHLLVCKLGLKHYLFKDKFENLPAAVQKNNRLYWLHKALQLIFGYSVLKLMAFVSHSLPI